MTFCKQQRFKKVNYKKLLIYIFSKIVRWNYYVQLLWAIFR